MSKKLFVKPPPQTQAAVVAVIIVSGLFLVFGVVFFIGVMGELGEALPFVAIFFLIWIVGCIAIGVHGFKMLKLIKSGKFEIAEITDTDETAKIGVADRQPDSNFAARLRDLEGLKKDGLITEGEYRRKRTEILNGKW